MKPDLPSVKESPWLKSYQPSGICSPKTSALMLGLGILSGAVTGFIGYYGGFLTSGLAQLGLVILGVIGGCGGCLGLIGAAIYALIFIGALGLGYPGLLGFGLGFVIWLLARKGKCRNSGLAVCRSERIGEA